MLHEAAWHDDFTQMYVLRPLGFQLWAVSKLTRALELAKQGRVLITANLHVETSASAEETPATLAIHLFGKSFARRSRGLGSIAQANPNLR